MDTQSYAGCLRATAAHAKRTSSPEVRLAASLVSSLADKLADNRLAEIPGKENRPLLERVAEPGRLMWHGKNVRLSVHEFSMLVALWAACGVCVSYDALFATQVRRRKPPSEAALRSNVRSAVRKIRKKFREAHPGFANIEACAGVGYRWATDADADTAAE
jgi:hypothetical protein